MTDTFCYYVSGHGYGHAIRTTQILRALPSDARIIVKTTAPASLFREELPGRNLEVVRGEYDCGSVQPDNLTVSAEETLRLYREIDRRNARLLNDEIDFLHRERIDCVVSDIASFPFKVAKLAGIPGIAVANFTWADIYEEYAETPDDAALLAHIREEYSSATAALITPLSLPTAGDPFPHVEHVPLVARRGANLRHALMESFDLPNGIHLALPYLGVWGMDIEWSRAAKLEDWVFLTFGEIPCQAKNIVSLSREKWAYGDVAASVDAVISKPGYGTVTECIASSVPLIYVPRHGFIEQDALIAGITLWGGGVPISEADFLAGDWEASLNAALVVRPNPAVFPTDGAEKIAERLVNFAQRSK